MSEANKTIVRRVIEDMFNQRNLEIAKDLIAQDVVDHTENVHGLEEYIKLNEGYLKAFPDLKVTILDLVAEGDRVVVRYVLKGTHQGEMMGIDPTGKTIEIGGIEIDRIADGKLAEAWNSWDALGMLQQLGVGPQMGE